MNHWPFVLGAYALTMIGAGGLTAWSLATMRRAEAAADAVRRDR